MVRITVLVLRDAHFVEGGEDFAREDLDEQRVVCARGVDLTEAKRSGVSHGVM
jgi:hypothetical protein